MSVPGNFVSKSGYGLGSWVSNIRNRYHVGLLSQDRIERLNEMDFIWDYLEDNWMKGYRKAKRYYREHGNLIVPKKYCDKTDISWAFGLEHSEEFTREQPMGS